jgi:ABC-2 type transport system ATP-binding protein
MSDAVVEMNGLTRYFGAKAAVRDLSLRVPRGSVFALLGRNGARRSSRTGAPLASITMRAA